MEQSQYLNKISIYGNKELLKNSIRKSQAILRKILYDHALTLDTLEINLVSDEELININRTALNHDYFTDIITFDYSEQSITTGDIYISIDRIIENAMTYKVAPHDELIRVMCHGVLHLSGYKDKTKVDKELMTKMENKYLQIYKNK
ncbi:MAG: rRNA maturation RNase YbeY [bacterium]|nr:rRNA maturation RNase YbeY [bacterium]